MKKLLQRVLMTVAMLLGVVLGLGAVQQGTAQAYYIPCEEYSTTLRFEVIDNDNRPVPGATYDIDYAKCVNDEPQRAGTIRITTGPDGRVDVPYPYLHWRSPKAPDFVDWKAGYTYLPALSPQAEAHWAAYNYHPSFHHWGEYRFPQERYGDDVTQYHMVLKRLGHFLSTPNPTLQAPATTTPPQPAPTTTTPKVDTVPPVKPAPSSTNQQASNGVEADTPSVGSTDAASSDAAGADHRQAQALCGATDTSLMVSDCAPFPVDVVVEPRVLDAAATENPEQNPARSKAETTEHLVAVSIPEVPSEPEGDENSVIRWGLLVLALGAAAAGTLLAARLR
jgi:hypothetical protein